MGQAGTQRERRVFRISAGVAFLLCFLCALVLQWHAGAYSAEISGSDEAAHFVTALMIHDYVAGGMPGSPRKFAENYYVHYPKVAFGIWPPLFHVTQAVWMLGFSRSRAAVLLLMAVWAATLAALCFAALRTRFGGGAALCAAIVLISLPAAQSAAATDMPDAMMSCFIFAAALSFARYLDRQRAADALWFGVMSAAAIMVKYNALALALVPPIAILLSRRFGLLRRPSFYLPVVVVGAVCGPWYLWNRSLVRYAMEPQPGIADIPGAVRDNLAGLAAMVGLPLLAMALYGAFTRLRRMPRRDEDDGIWIAMASLIAAVWLFHSVLYPIYQDRYLLSAAPALLVFAVAGAASLIPRRFTARRAIPAAIAGMCLVYAFTTFRFVTKRHYGFSQIAARVASGPAAGNECLLVSGSAETEGMVISEMALLDGGMRHCVLRASKILAHSTWMGEHYEIVYRTSDEMMRFLELAPISMIVMDRSPEYRRPHHELLQQAIASRPDRWAPAPAVSGLFQVFERVGPPPQDSGGQIFFDLSHTIGTRLAVPRAEPSR